MTDHPEIQYLDIREFDDETIRWIFDQNGKLIGAAQTRIMTREELERLYPEALNKVQNPSHNGPSDS